jgi:hypothetical protein
VLLLLLLLLLRTLFLSNVQSRPVCVTHAPNSTTQFLFLSVDTVVLVTDFGGKRGATATITIEKRERSLKFGMPFSICSEQEFNAFVLPLFKVHPPKNQNNKAQALGIWILNSTNAWECIPIPSQKAIKRSPGLHQQTSFCVWPCCDFPYLLCWSLYVH